MTQVIYSYIAPYLIVAGLFIITFSTFGLIKGPPKKYPKLTRDWYIVLLINGGLSVLIGILLWFHIIGPNVSAIAK